MSLGLPSLSLGFGSGPANSGPITTGAVTVLSGATGNFWGNTSGLAGSPFGSQPGGTASSVWTPSNPSSNAPQAAGFSPLVLLAAAVVLLLLLER